MKKLFVLGFLLALVGCAEPTPQPTWVRTSTSMHDVAGFEDCTYAELGYAVFFISSLAGLHLLRISNASKTLYWVTVMFMCINVLGFVRAL